MLNDLTTQLSLTDIIEHPGKVFPAVLMATLIATVAVIFIHLVLALVSRRPAQPHSRFNLWEKLVYLGTLVAVAVAGVTSFYSVLRFGGTHGWWLFFHMFGAGALTGVLPLLALTWGGANRFGQTAELPAAAAAQPRFFWIPRVMFWLFLVSGFVVMMTMLVSMLPLFGSEGLEVLLDIHRYAGLLAVVTLAIHFYAVILQRVGLR